MANSATVSVLGAGGNTITGSTGAQVTDSSNADTYSGANYSLTFGASNNYAVDDASNLTVLNGGSTTDTGIYFGVNGLNFNDDATGALAVGYESGVTRGSVTLEANSLNLRAGVGGLTIADASGVTSATLVLTASNFNVTDDASNLAVTDASGVTVDGVYIGANGLNLDDDATGGLAVDYLAGVSSGSVTLEANSLSLRAGVGGLTIADASGVTSGTLVLAASNLSTTDDASNLAVTDASGASGGNIFLGANGLNLIDDAANSLGVAYGSGVTNGAVTLGANSEVLYSYVSGLTISDASGVTSGTLVLNPGSLSTTDDASNLAVTDASGAGGGNIFLGANGLNLIDDAANSLGVAYGSGVTSGAVTLGANSEVLFSYASGLTISDGSGVTNGTLLFGASNLTTIDAASGLTLADGSGMTGETINVANNIGSAVFDGGGMTINAGTGDDGGIVVEGTTGSDLVNWGSGLGSETVAFNPISGITAEYTEWSGANASGTEGEILTDLTAGGSQLEQYNPQSGTLDTVTDYSGANGSGELTGATTDYINGYSSDYTYNYDSSGDLEGLTGSIYSSPGDLIGTVDYNDAGQETSGWGDVESYSDLYTMWEEYGVEEEISPYMFGLSSLKQGTNSDATGLAAVEAKLGNQNAAIGSEIGQLQAQTAAETPTAPGLTSAIFAPFVWSKKTITWTMDAPTGTGTPFTGTLGSQYESALQQAFQTWAQASGLTFVEVSGADADIKLGLAELDPVDTGIQGLSQVHARGGQAVSADIMLEDPAEDPLATDANGQLAYTGTQTELEQLMLHEIGHVLGLADSSDPGSVMAAVLTNANDALDATDLQGIQALYGATATGAPTVATIDYWNNLQAESARLIQSMASFTSPNAVALSSQGLVSPIVNPIQLAAAH